MKKLLLLLLVLLAPTPAWASFAWYRTVTVDHTKVPSNQANMTILVCANSAAPCNTSVSGLNQSGGGAEVTQADGDDIVFGTNNTCSVLLNWDPLYYVAATGEMIAWVEFGTLSSTVDDVFYMCYGDSGVTTFQGGASGTAWHSSYLARHRLGDGTTLSLLDSTANNFDGTNNGLTATAGKIDGGSDGDGTTSNGYITGSDSIVTGTALTWGGWFTATDAATGSAHFGKGDGSVYDWMVYLGAGTPNYYCFLVTANGTFNVNTGVGWDTTFRRVVCNYDGANLTAWVGGTNVGNTAATGNIVNTSMSRVGWSDFLNGTQTSTGKHDETWVGNMAWTNDRETTEFNNQNAPSTFSAFGSQTAPAGGAVTCRRSLLGVGC